MIIIRDINTPTYFRIPYSIDNIYNSVFYIKTITNEDIYGETEITLSSDILNQLNDYNQKGYLIELSDYDSFFGGTDRFEEAKSGLFLIRIVYNFPNFDGEDNFITYKEVINYLPSDPFFNILDENNVYY